MSLIAIRDATSPPVTLLYPTCLRISPQHEIFTLSILTSIFCPAAQTVMDKLAMSTMRCCRTYTIANHIRSPVFPQSSSRPSLQALQQQQQQLKHQLSQQRWRSTHRGGTRTALFFPGQGVQRVGMLTPWLETFPSTASQLRDEIDEYMGYKLSDIIQNGPSKLLTETPNAQPAIMATSIFILRILEREFNFRVTDHFDVTLGHSLGEFAAVVAGGYISFQDSLHLVRKRAEAMSDATKHAIEKYGGEYGMVAVISHPEHMDSLIQAIREFVGISAEDQADLPPIEQVLIANINSKNQIVLSGNIERIKTLIAHVRQFLGYDPRAVRLKADSPFHSPIMQPAVTVMRQLLEEPSRVEGREKEDVVTFPGKLPIVSNVSARPVCCKKELKDLLARGCLDTVRWWDSIKYLDQEARIRRWVGVGPGKVGRNLVGKEVGMRGKDLVKGGGVWAITDPSEVEEVLRGLEDTANLMEDDEYSE